MQHEQDILALLKAIADGSVSPDHGMRELRFSPFIQTLDGITADPHRTLRTGLGETIFAEGKSDRALASAVQALAGNEERPVLATRVSPAQGAVLSALFPGGRYWEEAGLFCLGKDLALAPPWPEEGDIIILSAGASDARVALEALGTARFHGLSAAYAADVGVAGLHRLRPWLPALDKAKAAIVCAGMEGALPSVIAGLARCPVLAVPVSVGYGAGRGGYAALLGMLSSCSPGIAVLNIDNGYGAAMFAAKMLKAAQRGYQ